MKLSNELLKEAKQCKSAEEIKTLAKRHGVELSEKDAAEAYARLNKSGELEDCELDSVAAGGGCYTSGDAPLYAVGDIVSFEGTSGEWKIVSVSSEKTSSFGIYPEFTYGIEKIGREGDIWKNIYEHRLAKIR